ncbi:MAG: translation initiation factor IF-2 [Candidatus Bipolaricaulota bacterium]
MAKKRVYEIAKELGVPTKELISTLAELGMEGLRAVNAVEEEEAEVIRDLFQESQAKGSSAEPEETVTEEEPSDAEEAPTKKPRRKAPQTGDPRPPVVAVLGHIDHGKTTLLDAIRRAHVAAGEAGGITQSIGAYQAQVGARTITFVDTPGHKAFTAMRARGAQVTDIAVLVVAADDGVMAQTVEAIDHIKAAQLPMIVAINKVDKGSQNLDRVRQEIAQHGFTPEDWGGDTIMVPMSALNEEGVDDLLEMILLVADMEDVRGEPTGELDATVIESHIDPARGPLATVIVKNGTLKQRDYIVVGSTWGRIRALLDHQGQQVPAAGPGTPVQIMGLNVVPDAGEQVEAFPDQKRAKREASARKMAEQAKRQTVRPAMTFEDLLSQAQIENLYVVLKAPSMGALEAARGEMNSVEQEGVEIQVLHQGVGTITESDVLLLSAVTEGQPLVLGFGVKVDNKARGAAENHGIPIRTYDLIYDLTEDVQRAVRRLAGPEYVEKKVGEAEVLQIFDIDGVGTVAGCAVTSGRVIRGGSVKVRRDGEAVHTGEIQTLRRFAQDVREVQSGRECGIRVRDFDEVQQGDVLEIYSMEEVQPE